MALEGKRINELTEVSKVDTSSKLAIDTGGEEALSITLKNLIDSSGIGGVDIATTEKAGIIKVGNNLTIADDGTLNANTDTLATKAELAGYLPLSGGTLTGQTISLNNFISYAFYVKDPAYNYTWYRALRCTGKNGNIVVGQYDGHVGLELQTPKNAITANIKGVAANILTTLDKAVANGVASLDKNAKVPENQLPDSVANQAILREW